MADNITLGELAEKMKQQLPYLFRYDLDGRDGEPIDLRGVARTPDGLLQAMVNRLDAGWRGAVLSFGLVLYRNQKNYPFGRMIDPQG